MFIYRNGIDSKLSRLDEDLELSEDDDEFKENCDEFNNNSDDEDDNKEAGFVGDSVNIYVEEEPQLGSNNKTTATINSTSNSSSQVKR